MTSWCFFPPAVWNKSRRWPLHTKWYHIATSRTNLLQFLTTSAQCLFRVVFVHLFGCFTHTQSHTLAQNARMRANADTHSLGALEEGRRQGMRRERSSGTTPTLMLPKQNQPGREGTQTAKTGKREGQGDGRLKHNNAKHGFSRYCSDRQRRCYELIVTN